MSGLRSLVWGALADEGLLLAEGKRDRLGGEAMARGRRSLPRAPLSSVAASRDELMTPAGSLGLAEPVLPRIFGLGAQQAEGLAAIAGTPARARREVARLGGLFNLGVALFDHVCDGYPKRAELLLAQVTPAALDAQLVGRGQAAPASGDAGVDLLVTLIADFFAGAHGLGGAARDRRTFARLIRSMYGGEQVVTATRRQQDAPTPRIWQALRRKSVLPMETMALLALLAHLGASTQERSEVRIAAALAGEAIWIVDDLADVREDWSAGCWSRPLWLLAHARGETPADGEDAIQRLLDAGIAAAEARRLADRLSALRALPGASERTFLRPLQAVVHSWIDLMPG
jgi:hypothetical protein